MRIEIRDNEYRKVHGKAPKNEYGFWIFEVEGCHELSAYGKLSEAKKYVRDEIKQIYNQECVFVEIMP